jgi:penicillin-binding protein 1A
VDFQKSQFNRAIQSARQPGSSCKPFIYAAALEYGFNPSSILMDTPQALGGVDQSLNWKPRNYDGEFLGPMTLRRALEVSRNIPTVRLVQSMGVNKVLHFMERLHINASLPRDMSLSLGSFGISLAELAKGYAIFPNGGKAIRLNAITSIKDRYGKTYPIPALDEAWKDNGMKKAEPVAEATPAAEGEAATPPAPTGNPFLANLDNTQVYDRRLAYIMTNLLKGVAHYGTAAAAASLGNVGGKTGTTTNYVDALFVGFTENLVVATWTGFDDNRPMGYGETGTRAALPMWMDYMKEAIPKYGAPDFPVPEGITHLLVNKETGKELPPGIADGFLESFVTGYGPENRPGSFDQNGSPDSASVDDDNYYMNQ